MAGLDLSRRVFFCGCVFCFTAPLAMAQDALASGGCFLNAASQEDAYEDVAKGLTRRDFADTTGDPDFDKAFGRAIIRLAGFFGEQPEFGIVEGKHHDNAYALPKSAPGAGYGTVGFGRTLLERLRAFDESGMAIMAIVAHEFAHVAQFRRNAMASLNQGQSNVRRSELHADYLAGCYLGWIKRTDARVSVRLAGQFMESIGDTNFASTEHHGTEEERLRSVETGFALASKSELEFETYFNRGKSYVLATF